MAEKCFIHKKAGWEDYWGRITVRAHLANCATDGLLPILEKHLPHRGRVLEAGCGLGKWVIFLRERGYAVCGIDKNKKAIAAAKKYQPGLPVEVGDVEKLRFPGSSLAAYLSFGVIEHWEEGPVKPLAEARRVLQKGGVAIVETPYDNWLRRGGRLLKQAKAPLRFLLEVLGLRKKQDKGPAYFYEYRYRPDELAGFLRAAGFAVAGIFPKDDLAPERSIGLWLDYPFLRAKEGEEFSLNRRGRLIKRLLTPWPWLWAACVVVVARKK